MFAVCKASFHQFIFALCLCLRTVAFVFINLSSCHLSGEQKSISRRTPCLCCSNDNTAYQTFSCVEFWDWSLFQTLYVSDRSCLDPVCEMIRWDQVEALLFKVFRFWIGDTSILEHFFWKSELYCSREYMYFWLGKIEFVCHRKDTDA